MLKKFFKKIGKGIKKVSKGITKGLKSLFKSKVGKIIGTIALMFIAPYLLSSAGSFFTGTFGNAVTAGAGGTAAGAGTAAAGTAAGTAAAGTAATSAASTKALTIGQKMVNAFKTMGTKVKGTFNNITSGIKNFFTGGTTTGTTGVTTTGTTGVTTGVDVSSTNVVDAVANGVETNLRTTLPTKPTATPIQKLTRQPQLDTSTVKEVTDAAGIIDTKVVKVDPKPSLLKTSKTGATATRTGTSAVRTAPTDFVEGGPMDDFALSKADKEFLGETKTVRPGKNLGDRLVRKATDQETFIDRVADFWHGDTKYKTIKEHTFGIQPLKNVEALPGFIREGTVGEAVAIGQFLQKPEEPYNQPYSDMSGAYAALSNVDLSGGMGLDQIGPSVPNAMSMTQAGMDTGKWLDLTKKYGYIYDASRWG